jgi:hypothetical protein
MNKARMMVTGMLGGGAGDTTAPTCVISSTANYLVPGAFTCTFTFSEDVTGFELGDITVANGTAGTFGTTSASVYTAVITPTATGTVTVDVAEGVCTDAAGNPNEAATQFSIVYVAAAAWYDFSDLTKLYQTNATTTPVTANGQTIGYVADKSGNSGRQVTQATEGNRPTWKANAQNSRGAGLFGGSHWLKSGDFGAPGTQTQPNTIFLVSKNTDAEGTGNIMIDGYASGYRHVFYPSTGDTPDGYQLYAGTTMHPSAVPFPKNAYTVWTLLFNTTASKIWENGTLKLSGDAGTNNLVGYTIGASSGNTSPFSGEHGEIIYVNANLTDPVRIAVQAALNAKWAVF